MAAEQVDELVSYISIFRHRPVLLHGYVLPFVLAYACWCWAWVYAAVGTEGGITLGVLILGVHLLTCLACRWSVHVRCLLTCTKVKNARDANIAKVVPTPNNGSAELVPIHHTTDTDGTTSTHFTFQKTKYIYDYEERKQFSALSFPIDMPVCHYVEWRGYQDDSQHEQVLRKFGKNEVVMDVPEFMELFRERATAPFFVFQVLCVGLWCLDEYWYYSVSTLVMLVLFEATLVKQQLRNMAEIRKMTAKPYTIQVYRGRRWKGILSNELVPGDIVSVPRSPPSQDTLLPCDLILLRGSCVLDESMLTGESIPQMKESIESLASNPDTQLDFSQHCKLHVLFGGTRVLQHTPPSRQPMGLRGPDGGCLCYVARTGFSTCQGRLLRTILYGVSRATVNTMETFAFILFLLVFALVAASYVWIKGTEDPTRNRYKLFLECTLILTSAIPPELPIELSLAVNTSLLSLSHLLVYCTEPFRIPCAGKVDVCCFDKTGTLTSDDLVVEGVVGLSDSNEVVPVNDAPLETIQVLASCHSLVQLEDGLVGDPQEKATLSAIDWTLTKGDTVVPRKGKLPGMKIFQRYHFSSSLKRMVVLTGHQLPNSPEVTHIAAVKGAPETIRCMLSEVPAYYDSVYLKWSRQGARILALARKDLGKLTHHQVREMSRDDLECNLTFAGFLVISCPLKRDSKEVIKEILHSSHAVTMITGDNALTACHVAKELKFTQKKATLILQNVNESTWEWRTIDDSVQFALQSDNITATYDLCLTGEGLSYLQSSHPSHLRSLLPCVRVFARVSPQQKEQVVNLYKELGFTTLMCGDGTNDVGALKHAQCGVAILSSAPDRLPQKKTKNSETSNSAMKPSTLEKIENARKLSKRVEKQRERLPPTSTHRQTPQQEQVVRVQAQLQKLLQEIEEDINPVVKLGDASIAAPFTSKLSSIQCVCHIIKQGRCTLVTTLQMFKILALNALILAYSQSVLYLDGIKFSDYQATLQGLLVAACFLFITRSKPVAVLSKSRPLPNIFNMYTIMTVLLQFCVHFTCLVYIVSQAKAHSPNKEKKVDLDKEFEPSLLNSTVYIISISLQISAFAINYRGRPFMEGLMENRALLYILLGSGLLVLVLALGIVPELSMQFEIVQFPPQYRIMLVQVLFIDLFASLVVDRLCLYLLGEGSLPPSLAP